jgi:sugar-specific transcriptional regulator TrmB
LSEETIKKVLKDFGLTQTEAEVYIFLARHGVLKGTEIAKQIKKDKAQVYHILKSLQAKGLVLSTLEAPVRFMPIPFEHIIESTIKAKKDEAARIESTKQEMLDYWKSMNKTNVELPLEKFGVINGRNKIYSKISEMIAETKNQLSAITTVNSLLQADQFDLFNFASKHALKSKIQFRFLTELSIQNLNAMKAIIGKGTKKGFNFRGKNPDLWVTLFPQMVIRDNEETIFFITPNIENAAAPDQDDVCFWTNCKSIVQAFTAVFENLWRNSIAIDQEISEIENGKPSVAALESRADMAVAFRPKHVVYEATKKNQGCEVSEIKEASEN